MKLSLLVLLSLLSTLQSALADSSEDFTVRETCDHSGCSLTFLGKQSACMTIAKRRSWNSGFEAAVSIRNCLDLAASRKVAAK